MQIRTTGTCHLTPVRMGIIKKTRDDECRQEDVEKRKPYALLVGIQPLWKTVKLKKNRTIRLQLLGAKVIEV